MMLRIVRMIIVGNRRVVRHPKARKITLSGLSIIPTLHEIPKPSALALMYDIRKELSRHRIVIRRAISS